MKKIYLFISIALINLSVFGQNTNTDCNGIVNGPAVIDNCGNCQMAYIYNMAIHTVEFVNDTYGLNVSPPLMLVLPQDPGNPYWNDCGNNYAVDCNGFVYGPALVDNCNECRLAYIYNVVTHDVNFINHVDGHTLLSDEIMVMPDDPSNPLWNDCNTTDISSENILHKEPIRVLDLFGRELNRIIYNQTLVLIFEDGTVEKRIVLRP